MKKLSLALLMISFSMMNAQENSVNKNSFFGIQAGLFGFNSYNETLLSKEFALRSEIDFEASIWGGDLYSKTGFALAPELSVSPKWYYNLSKRENSGKNTSYNAANYISARVGFTPDWFVISNVDGIVVNPMLSVVPTWGFRRNFARDFNYEFQIGLGIGKIMKSGYDIQAVPNLSFRIGYDF